MASSSERRLSSPDLTNQRIYRECIDLQLEGTKEFSLQPFEIPKDGSARLWVSNLEREIAEGRTDGLKVSIFLSDDNKVTARCYKPAG